jgi:hypothetical protein
LGLPAGEGGEEVDRRYARRDAMQHRLHLTRIGTLQSEIREQHDHVLARVRPTPLHDRAFAAAQATKRSAGLSETTPLTSSFRPSRDSGESRNDQSEFSRRPRGAQRARRAVKNASGDAGRYSRSFGLSASLASPPCGEWKAYRVTAAIARNSISNSWDPFDLGRAQQNGSPGRIRTSDQPVNRRI